MQKIENYIDLLMVVDLKYYNSLIGWNNAKNRKLH
ncbi:MAG: hypothetical protein HeimC3_54900 [Candidatus Heimdallarchaeota archaeon LC_3]|nr:MAG: hypothetical protein HeimC3_54840 [Candidatus Heimdallarchaeota archaeon LC_3]OLS16369.1 MAG: hypothetical protein HeimC3_54850 [Candidatus Heimdallarchaeota archaeon LC_3]OLS16370.1 MAG: hypothetical protein HeimC3_54860 [Candidatus Heimdallarchaeota archaeon LC_3]OLS16371.1 MAG: hypothetical protein HeimC3_54870 [Candidatus Heimdallarchaeota archaeon LC_3]OLS16372.1 MAG: hypothetical protein HeimC3_54880 [Candidatus Heimdallarchaeota archaeon LC_3]